MEKYVPIKDVAIYLSVSTSTVYHWVNIQFIPHYKVRTKLRFKLSEIENWMKRRRVKGRDSYKLAIDI